MNPVTDINSKKFVRSILGEPVICTLTDGRTASGRLICVDRLKNLILADCVCKQRICSMDYTPTSSLGLKNQQPPVYQIASRHLQQAMVPGSHLVSVHLQDRTAYESAIQAAMKRTNNDS